ncbi:TIGR03809 family protein [Bradyrhizobium diazoefficiens]|nr:TIGR03809 family protein [Bradyrhizobium diazoefficiens]MBR0774925.1 TIGR03809 family protein [Bradyrhizobium diazoefficiens]
MTHRQSAAGGRDNAARWCALAEQRLEHLSEMFETGRWRRYHSELAFLENIQEAKRAVQTWRAIATGGDVKAAAASVTSGFGWSPATLSRTAPREQARTLQGKTFQSKSAQLDNILSETLQLQPVIVQPKPLETKALETKPLETKALEARELEPLTVQPKTSEPKTSEPRTFQPKTFQPKTFEPKTFEPKTWQPKAVQIVPETAVPVALGSGPDVLADVTEAPIAPVAPLAPVAAFLPQFSPPAADIVAAPERVVEITLSLDGIKAKYPLLRNKF